jgi:hypothetical protein
MMWPKMTREQFDQMTIEELAEWAFENIDYVHHEDALIDLAKHEIDKENLNVAIHILTGIYESEEAVGDYYIYDRCMGTLEEVVPITCKEDLEEYIDFEEDEEERAAERREAIEETLQQWHDRFNMEEEE